MSNFKIKYPDRFAPNASFLLKGGYVTGNKVVKATYNPSKAESKTGYKPRLTLYRAPYFKGGQNIFMHIEYSVPKLLFGNNFVELNGMADFPRVIERLHDALASMGIETERSMLIQANVSSAHFSKNIILDRHIPCSLLIRELNKAHIPSKLDIAHVKFKNGGQAIHYHTSSYEIAIYDKIKELEQAKKYGDKRSAEQDNALQFGIMANKRLPEILRIEVRLRNKKLKEICQKFTGNSMLTNVNFFDANLSRKILLHYWEIISDGLFMLNLPANDPEALTALITQAFPRKRPLTKAQLVGFIHTANALGIRGAQQALSLPNMTFNRMKADMKALDALHTIPRFSAIKAVKRQLSEFIPVTADDIGQAELLNLKVVSGKQ